MPKNFRNPFYQDLIQGFRDRMNALGQPFTHQRSNSQFLAIAIAVPMVDPRSDLGADPREMITLEMQRSAIPLDIKMGDVLSQDAAPWSRPGDPALFWKLVRREDNGAQFTIKFWAVKITSKDAQ